MTIVKGSNFNYGTVTIYLNEISKLYDLVNTTKSFDARIEATSDGYDIDAKSILGLLSLNLSKPIDLFIDTDDEAELDRFVEAMKDFEYTE